MPGHLRVRFEIRPDGRDGRAGGEPLAAGEDLAALQRELAAQVSRTLSSAAAGLTRTGATSWDFGVIAEELELDRDGHRVVGYPALVDEGPSVGLVVADTRLRSRELHRLGLRRLDLFLLLCHRL